MGVPIKSLILLTKDFIYTVNKLIIAIKNFTKIVPLFIRPFSLATIPVTTDGDLAEEFRTGKKLL